MSLTPYFGMDVLVVEDSQQDYKLLISSLQRDQPEGYVVKYRFKHEMSLAGASKALHDQVDIVLLDLYLPDSIDPLKTFQTMREQTRDKFIPVIVMTSLKDLTVGLQCLRAGAAAYYLKDWVVSNPLLLHMKLAYMYELSRRERELQDFIKERLGEFRQLIPRCKFCENRIGIQRWKDESNGEWLLPAAYIERFSKIRFTDGVCEDCAKLILADKP